MAEHGGFSSEDHPITVEPTGRPVRVEVDGRRIAETTSASTLREAGYPPVHYVPLTDVDPALLRRSETTTYCPFKGTASYYDLVPEGGTVLTDAVWAYEEPYPGVAAIAGLVAFDPARVRTEPVGGA